MRKEIGMKVPIPDPGIRVVKLGGSLADTPFLQNWLEVLAEPGRKGIVLVPGGGDFADQVRISQKKWQFDDRTAHCMALLAMQQYALMLASFSTRFEVARRVREIPRVLAEQRVVLWMPEVDELDRAGIPSTWRITSDSLSAWLAGRLAANRLLLVKSTSEVRPESRLEELAREGIVDPLFPEYSKTSGVPVKIFHASAFQQGAVELDPPLRADRIPQVSRFGLKEAKHQ